MRNLIFFAVIFFRQNLFYPGNIGLKLQPEYEEMLRFRYHCIMAAPGPLSQVHDTYRSLPMVMICSCQGSIHEGLHTLKASIPKLITYITSLSQVNSIIWALCFEQNQRRHQNSGLRQRRLKLLQHSSRKG